MARRLSFLITEPVLVLFGHYSPSVGFIELVSHTTCVVSVTFIHKRRDLQFKVGSKRQMF